MAVDLTTYTGLLAHIASTLNRRDLTDQIPAFVTQHEAKMNRELRVRDMHVRAQATTTGEYIQLPGDFLAPYTLELAAGTRWCPPLRFMTEEEARTWRSENPSAGLTKGFTIFGNEIELIDPPTTNLDFRLKYFARVPSLSATNPSNWLLQKSPDLYVAGSCLEAALYLKNDDRLTTWGTIRQGILDGMTLESERALKPQNKLNAARRSFG